MSDLILTTVISSDDLYASGSLPSQLSHVKGFGVESQEPVTHHPSSLEVAPVPRTPRNPSSAVGTKLSRAIWF
ncbi:Testis-Expressed Protein 35 [Manis pentadactyla]|nr:Testis-Expressed Protein 35 [Manis pentadactyla]